MDERMSEQLLAPNFDQVILAMANHRIKSTISVSWVLKNVCLIRLVLADLGKMSRFKHSNFRLRNATRSNEGI